MDKKKKDDKNKANKNERQVKFNPNNKGMINTDILGSYTGRPLYDAEPEQDSDDL